MIVSMCHHTACAHATVKQDFQLGPKECALKFSLDETCGLYSPIKLVQSLDWLVLHLLYHYLLLKLLQLIWQLAGVNFPVVGQGCLLL